MKKYVLMTAIVTVLALPSMAWSQQGSAPGGSGGGQKPAMQGGQQGDSETFQDRKTRILARLNERSTEVQKRIACVQAAADREALRACMPERGDGRGEGGGGQNGGPAGQGGKK